MYAGKLVFAQVMEQLPLHRFHACVARYGGERKVQRFSCLDQFLCMAFAQLTYRESLREVETCLRAQRAKLYHMGFRSVVARNTLANANRVRDWRIYADFAQALIAIARRLYAGEALGMELEQTVFALDSTLIDLTLSVFPWAPYQQSKAAVQLHTLLDLLLPEPGAIYVMDRGYIDFARLYALHRAGAFFVIRDRASTRFRRRYSHPVDRGGGLICDQTIVFTGWNSAPGYPEPVRRIKLRLPDRAQTARRRRPRPGPAAHQAAPPRPRADPGAAHQQHRAASQHYRRALSLPLADRAVLQVNQAAPAHQGVLRRLGERRAQPDLDRGERLCAGCHPEETPRPRRLALHNPTDPQPYPVRESPARSTICPNRHAAGPAPWP